MVEIESNGELDNLDRLSFGMNNLNINNEHSSQSSIQSETQLIMIPTHRPIQSLRRPQLEPLMNNNIVINISADINNIDLESS